MSPETVKQFKEIYFKKFKEELTNDEALNKVNKLLDLYKLLYGSSSLKRIKNERHKINGNNNQ